MVDQVLENIYRIEVPLPQNPLKSLNSFVISGPDRSLIVDTGMNRPECESVINAGLLELGVDRSKTDLFITHMHADHSGLIAALAGETSAIYCSREDGEIINFDDSHWEYLRTFVKTGGFPADDFDRAIQKHPGYKYRTRNVINFTTVQDGDEIRIGDYLFVCVSTPGHTTGHMCLYEPQHRILLSGDHILKDITPNISLWSDDEDPLAEYLESLEKIRRMPVDLVLPGHRTIFRCCNERIDELKKHHRTRADEVLSILSESWQNAYQVAAQMTWDMTYESFAEFPIAQKWFATGEALAHLKYLEVRRQVKRELKNNVFVYALQ